jgi:hypothetical protein
MVSDNTPNKSDDNTDYSCPQSEWTFNHIDIGGSVEFSIGGVDDSFVKLTGSLRKIENNCAVFSNLNGVSSVKQKFHPNSNIIIFHGNRVYFSKIIELKAMILTVASPPYKVSTQKNNRSHKRYDCNINAQTIMDQRGVTREKAIIIKNISREGCCVSIQRSKDDMATGLSVGKILTVIIIIKSKPVSFQGIIKNVRKDNANEAIKYAGIQFEKLSEIADVTLGAILTTLERIELLSK